MKSYAIFAGGGIKGAAFAGCLKAANQLDIEFLGYAGASAGSIVALLACVGYTHQEIADIMLSQDFVSFFDDRGTRLDNLSKTIKNTGLNLRTWIKAPLTYLRHRSELDRLVSDYGLYRGEELEQFLLQKVKEACPDLQGKDDVSFQDLLDLGKPPLRIMVSDLSKRKPVICPSGEYPELSNSVIKSVRASAGYPFVFMPVLADNSLFVDGGLSCNLPVFAFQEERQVKNLPVIAFKLVQEVEASNPYDSLSFCGDMLNTALESSEALLFGVLERVYVVPVLVPSDISTLDFGISTKDRERLFDRGHSAMHSFYHEHLGAWSQSDSLVEDLQSLYVPEYAINPILTKLIEEMEEVTAAANVRANVMLPTARNTRIVVYQVGMDLDPDKGFELALDAGCSGVAWKQGEPCMANLTEARDDPGEWDMTQDQVNRVRADRQAVLSVPIFPSTSDRARLSEVEPIGVLSIDTSTSLDETEWMTRNTDVVVELAQRWADVISFVLRNRAF